MRKILITYETISPESVEVGEFEDQGWKNKNGESMEPDEYDREEGLNAIDLAARFLKDAGAVEPSETGPDAAPDNWRTVDPMPDYRTGEETYYTYHLKGFSEIEKHLVYLAMEGEYR